MPVSRSTRQRGHNRSRRTRPVVVPKNYGLIRKPRRIDPAQPMASPRRPGRRIAAAVAVVVALGATGVIAIALLVIARHRNAVAIPLEAPLSSYRIVYRVDTPGATTREEERDIARPFDGRYVERSNGAVTAGFLTNDEGTWAWTSSGTPGWIPAENGLNRATADQHAAAALAAGQQQGLSQVLGRRHVLGRACVEVRTGSPIGQPLSKPTHSDHADLCVDRTGVVLEETWTRGGQMARHRVAQRFDADPALDSSTFAPQPAASTGSSAPTMAATSRPMTADEQAALGFTFDPPPGYAAVGPPTARVSSGGGGLPPVGDVVQYFRKGDDLIDVIQGSAGGPPAGVPITVPGLGRSYLSLDMTASSVTVVDGAGRYAKVEAADVTLLKRAAAGLRPAPHH